MTTVSVPLPAEMLQAIEVLVASGRASNKADAIRKAVQLYLEEEAVNAVLRARKEPRLEGDLDELLQQIV